MTNGNNDYVGGVVSHVTQLDVCHSPGLPTSKRQILFLCFVLASSSWFVLGSGEIC